MSNALIISLLLVSVGCSEASRSASAPTTAEPESTLRPFPEKSAPSVGTAQPARLETCQRACSRVAGIVVAEEGRALANLSESLLAAGDGLVFSAVQAEVVEALPVCSERCVRLTRESTANCLAEASSYGGIQACLD